MSDRDPSSENPGLLAPGTQLLSYEICSLLGVGRVGPTYLARASGQSEHVVIKEYCPPNVARRDVDQRVVAVDAVLEERFHRGLRIFRQQARILSRIDHPSVVHAEGPLQFEDNFFLVLEYLPGATLEQWALANPGPAAARLEPFLRAMASGLAAVHAAGASHLAVRPECIRFRDADTPVLLDFGGTARAIARRAHLSDGKGGYEPPEVRAGDEGPWSDIYSLAAVAYRLVAGHPPPAAVDRAEGLAMPAAVAVGANRYPTALLAAIDLGLTLDRSQRPSSVTDWLSRLPDGPAPRAASMLEVPGGFEPAGEPPSASTPPAADVLIESLAQPVPVRELTLVDSLLTSMPDPDEALVESPDSMPVPALPALATPELPSSGANRTGARMLLAGLMLGLAAVSIAFLWRGWRHKPAVPATSAAIDRVAPPATPVTAPLPPAAPAEVTPTDPEPEPPAATTTVADEAMIKPVAPAIEPPRPAVSAAPPPSTRQLAARPLPAKAPAPVTTLSTTVASNPTAPTTAAPTPDVAMTAPEVESSPPVAPPEDTAVTAAAPEPAPPPPQLPALAAHWESRSSDEDYPVSEGCTATVARELRLDLDAAPAGSASASGTWFHSFGALRNSGCRPFQYTARAQGRFTMRAIDETHVRVVFIAGKCDGDCNDNRGLFRPTPSDQDVSVGESAAAAELRIREAGFVHHLRAR